MRSRTGAVLVLTFAFSVCAALAQAAVWPDLVEVEWTPSVEVWSMNYVEAVENNDYEDAVSSDSWVRSLNELWVEEYDLFIKADGQWRYNAWNGGLENESRGEASFREVYGELRKEHYRFSAGEQILTWGKMDDITILDRVNPQDYRHFVLYDKQERKDPVFMLRHEYFGDGHGFETVYKPYFEASEVDYFGRNFAAFGHLKEAVDLGGYSALQKSTVQGIGIRDEDRATEHSLDNGEVALRYRSRLHDVDYGLYYMNQRNSIPVLRESSPVGNTVKAFLYDPTLATLDTLVSASPTSEDLALTAAHPRVQTIGADWETVLGEYGVRGEMAVMMGMPFLKEDYSYTEKDTAMVGVGIDHTFENSVYADLQYVQQYIFAYDKLYAQEEAPFFIAGTVSRDFVRGKFNASLDWTWNASYGDWMFNPELLYKPWDSLHIAFGSFIFEEGSASTLFGRYDTDDIIYVSLKGVF